MGLEFSVDFRFRSLVHVTLRAAHQGGSSNVPMVQPGPVLKVRRAGFFEQTGDLTT